MAQRRLPVWPVLAAVLGVLVVIIAMPQSSKGWAPSFLKNPALHLGLDLVGGTQLDFRISEQEIHDQLASVDAQIADGLKSGMGQDQLNQLQAQRQGITDQQANLVEAIRAVLERRINALGVSEATITPSYVGNEKHLLVECPGVVDTQECIKVVGKTIQLEFKEEFTQPTAEFTAGVRQKAVDAMRRITESGMTLKAVGTDMGDQLGVLYQDNLPYYKDQLPAGLEDAWTLPPGRVIKRDVVVKVPQQDSQGRQTVQSVSGVILTQVLTPPTETGRVINEAPKAFALLAKQMQTASYTYHADTLLDASMNAQLASTLRSMQAGDLKSVTMQGGTAHVLFLRGLQKGREEVAVSHILVAYKGATAADKTVTRTKDEALARAKALKAQLDAGADFAALARSASDGPSRSKGGSIGAIGRGDMVPAFEQIAFSQAMGKVSDPVETQFGYHLIRVDKAPAVTSDKASYDDLTLTGDAAKQADALITNLKNGQVMSREDVVRLRGLFFSLAPTGWKDTPLDGKHFRTAAVSMDPVTNIPVVQISFDAEGAKLFQELTKANIGKRIAIFVGGQLVSAPTVQTEIAGGTAVITGSQNFNEARQLAQDLNTGAIPAPIHLVGQYTIEATLGAAALRTSLMAAFIGTVILMLYMLVVYRLLGLMADIALFFYAVILFALLKLPVLLITSNYVVLTLAGMAGIILSIGMAVDANVLVFERMKEELRKGKTVKTAVEASFKHAWPAIRDSNVATLITCCILFLIGTSIVRGFALTLGMGVFISLFTAVTVTRWLIRKLATMPIANRPEMFGVSMKGGVDDVPDDR